MLITPRQLQASIRATRTLRIVKAADKRFVLGVSYPAADIDGHGEFMSADQLERTAWEYLRQQEIGLFHADGTTGHAVPVESYIHRAPPWTVTDVSGREQTVMPGDWLLGAIWDPQAWGVVKSGKVQGWSIDGAGKRRNVPRSDVEKARVVKALDPETAIREAIANRNSRREYA